jgi:tetratricopeptide (TPR) repeat protein
MYRSSILRIGNAIALNAVGLMKACFVLVPIFFITGCHTENSESASKRAASTKTDSHQNGASPEIAGATKEPNPESKTQPSTSQVDKEETPEIDVFTLHNDAAVALQADDHDKAYQLARQAMRIAPSDPTSVFLMARVLGRRNRFPEAIQMLDKLALTAPDARLPVLGQTAQWMVQFGMWKEAEQRFQTLLQEAPEATLVHRKLAELFVRQGRASEATEHLKTLCRLGDIEEIELRHLLAGGQPLHGDTALDELSPIGHRGKAMYAISREEWELARTELEALESRSAETLSILGRVYVHLDDNDSLNNWREEATQSELPDSESYFPKGAILAGQETHATAVRLLSKAVLFDQTDSDAYRLLSHSLLAVDRPNESKDAAKRFELISETKRIGREMSLTEDRDDSKFQSLIDSLDELQRPWESLHWSSVRLAYAKTNNSLTENELDRLASQIKERSIKLNSEGWIPDRQFVTCGIDLDSLEQTDSPIDTLPRK